MTEDDKKRKHDEEDNTYRYTFIGAKIDTGDTISSMIDPIKVETNISFIPSDKKIEDYFVLS